MVDRHKVEALKRSWKSDPCWDIEDTDGFEEHRDELKEFRLKEEALEKRKIPKFTASRLQEHRLAIASKLLPILIQTSGKVEFSKLIEQSVRIADDLLNELDKD